jgi:hypothetical protein
MLIFEGGESDLTGTAHIRCTAIRNSAYSSSAESLAALFFGSVCVFPVSSQSTDLPNSRLIASRTPAPGSFSPRSSLDRCP